MIRRLAAGTAVGTAVVLSVTGCLGDGGGKASGSGTANQGATKLTAAKLVSEVSQKTGEIRSFQATITSDTSVSGQHIRMSGQMAYRVKPTVAFKMSVPKMTVNDRTQAGFQEILLNDTLYVKMPSVSARTGKPWMRMSLDKLSAESGIDLKPLVNQSEQADPSAKIKMFTASKDVRKVGQETVAGTTTTHYQGTYSVQDALAKLPASQRAKIQQMMGQMGIDTMNFDLWVDGQNLPRKISLRTPAGSQVTTDTTVTYSGFNAPVSITAPPAGQVRDAG
jgi:hypothetical protein